MNDKNTTTTEIYLEDSTYIKEISNRKTCMRDKLREIINFYKENEKQKK